MKISLKHVQIHFSEKSLKSVKKLFFLEDLALQECQLTLVKYRSAL